jgi:hypothetical protein
MTGPGPTSSRDVAAGGWHRQPLSRPDVYATAMTARWLPVVTPVSSFPRRRGRARESRVRRRRRPVRPPGVQAFTCTRRHLERAAAAAGEHARARLSPQLPPRVTVSPSGQGPHGQPALPPPCRGNSILHCSVHTSTPASSSSIFIIARTPRSKKKAAGPPPLPKWAETKTGFLLSLLLPTTPQHAKQNTWTWRCCYIALHAWPLARRSPQGRLRRSSPCFTRTPRKGKKKLGGEAPPLSHSAKH